MKLVFRKVYVFDDKDYTEIDLNLDGLTGEDMLKAERQLASTGVAVGVPETSKAFQAALAANAAKVPVEFINGLPLREFSRVTMEVQNFLLL